MTAYHANDTSNKVKVIQMSHVGHVGGRIYLQGVVSPCVLKQTEHGIEEIPRYTKEPFSTGQVSVAS